MSELVKGNHLDVDHCKQHISLAKVGGEAPYPLIGGEAPYIIGGKAPYNMNMKMETGSKIRCIYACAWGTSIETNTNTSICGLKYWCENCIEL